MDSSDIQQHETSNDLLLHIEGSATIFLSGSTEPDTRLKVFGQEFHVHSDTLKLKSGWFRARMEVPGAEASSSDWRYLFVAAINTNNEFVLATADSEAEFNQELQVPAGFMGNIQSLASTSLAILKIIYDHPNSIDLSINIEELAYLANRLSVQPAVSVAISVALPILSDIIFEEPFPFLLAGRTLEHRELYTEAFTLVVARWNFEEYRDIWEPGMEEKDNELWGLIWLGYNQVGKLEQSVFDWIFEKYGKDEESMRKLSKRAEKATKSKWKEVDTHATANTYRFVLDRLLKRGDRAKEWEIHLIEEIESLLKSNLTVDKNRAAGLGDCEHLFLCVTVEDEDLPWGDARPETRVWPWESELAYW